MAINDLLQKAAERARQMDLPYSGALTPAEAHEVWRNAPGAKLVDVRTRAEWDYVGRIPGAIESKLMEMKMNSYGKTWHVWNSGAFNQQADALPLGEPRLAWSFNHDGEAQPGLVEQRDRRMRLSTRDKREQRASLVQMARPQPGVDAITAEFPGPTTPIPGVNDPATMNR